MPDIIRPDGTFEGGMQERLHEEALSFNHWLDTALKNFSEELESKHEQIDHDHRTLLRLAFDLNDAILANSSDAAVAVTEKKLTHYLRAHFATEEDIMLHIGYPDLIAHRKEHRMLTAAYEAIVEKFSSGQRQVEPLHRFLRDFVLTHIPKADRAFIHWMRANYIDRDIQ